MTTAATPRAFPPLTPASDADAASDDLATVRAPIWPVAVRVATDVELAEARTFLGLASQTTGGERCMRHLSVLLGDADYHRTGGA